jgi:uncharacterized membrane protein
MAKTFRNDPGYAPFIYLFIITLLSTSIIFINEFLHLEIPFHVSFLFVYICALMVFVLWHAILTKGWKKFAVIFFISFCIAFSAEILGVNFGLIFGSYYYTHFLGFGLLGVPFLAAFAWEPILYASYNICEIIFRNAWRNPGFYRNRMIALLIFGLAGAFATTAWDLMIDPIAVDSGWWVWIDGGSYMPDVLGGVPISNYIGWLAISFLIITIFKWRLDTSVVKFQSPMLNYYGPITLYTSLFLTSIGVTITLLEKPAIALIGLMTMMPFLLIASNIVYLNNQENVDIP